MPLTAEQAVEIVNKYQMRMSDMYRLSQGELFSIPPSRLGLSGGDVIRALVSGANSHLLEARHESGATLLHIAAKYGDDLLVDAILSRDFDGRYVNALTNSGRSPAQVAISAGKYGILNKLITAGADLFHSSAGSESAFVSMFKDINTKGFVIEKINQDYTFASNLYGELQELGQNALLVEALERMNPEFRERVVVANAETASIDSAEESELASEFGLEVSGEILEYFEN